MPMVPASEDDDLYLERILKRSQEAMSGLLDAQARVGQVTGRGRTGDGLVEATADGRGAVTALDLDPRAMRLDAATLGRRMAEAMRAAQQDAARQSQDILNEAFARVHDLPQPPDETFVRARVEQIARDLL